MAAGAYVPLTLAMRVPSATENYYVPVLTLGDLTFTFTTDSHLVTPDWQGGEVIVERFDFALPPDLPAGDYPLSAGFKNLSHDADVDAAYPLGTLMVQEAGSKRPGQELLANFRQRVGLEDAVANSAGTQVSAPGRNRCARSPARRFGWFWSGVGSIMPKKATPSSST